jgi:DNA-directed RNA polymerase specialized sigma24 family protein
VEGEDPGQFELMDLDRALETLAKESAVLAQIMELRYFGGMTAEEIAGVQERSVHTVRRDIRLAQAWLRRELQR